MGLLPDNYSLLFFFLQKEDRKLSKQKLTDAVKTEKMAKFVAELEAHDRSG